MSPDHAPSVAVLGTGTMGEPMARNLLRAGIAVHAYNRSPERATALEEDGARVHASPREAVEGADVILTVLSDGDATLEVAAAALPGAGEGAVWLQSGTIGLDATERCAALAADHGVAFVDAPVLGTRQPAEQGALIVLASGPEEEHGERLAPILDAIGSKTLWQGPAGAGTRLKLVCNTWVLALVEGLAESLALADRLGVDPEQFFTAIDGGPLDAGYAHIKGQAIQSRDFTPAFKLVHAAKDARLVAEAAAGAGLALPMVDAIAGAFEDGTAAGHGDEDMIASYLALTDR
jgi:3-hydroxyisobutyrate dehydrogenase